MNEAPRSERPILVLGGTGKTGRRVAQRLRRRRVPIRIGSRAGAPPFDWDDPATWGAALDGVSAVYVTFVPDVAVPGAAETVGAFARHAVACGVERLVLLSGRGEARRLAERAGGAASRRAVDDRALELVRSELQRGLPAARGVERRGRTAGRHDGRAVRRRRRHRRRRGRRAHRRRSRRSGLRGHRTPPLDVRRSGRRDRARHGSPDPVRVRVDE